jgi:hypothetical protein
MRNKTMRHEYDILERFPDGSSIWRATVLGRYQAQRKMQELAEHSENLFFRTDTWTTPLAIRVFEQPNRR